MIDFPDLTDLELAQRNLTPLEFAREARAATRAWNASPAGILARKRYEASKVRRVVVGEKTEGT